MRTLEFRGEGRTCGNAYVEDLTEDARTTDFHGNEVVVRAGSRVRHFETTNKGWIVWRVPGEDRTRISDVGQ